LGADFFGDLERRAGHPATNADDEHCLTRFELSIGDQHAPMRDEYERTGRGFLSGKDKWRLRA
jgi:hypothetical protein